MEKKTPPFHSLQFLESSFSNYIYGNCPKQRTEIGHPPKAQMSKLLRGDKIDCAGLGL